MRGWARHVPKLPTQSHLTVGRFTLKVPVVPSQTVWGGNRCRRRKCALRGESRDAIARFRSSADQQGRLATFVQGEEVVLPNPIGIGLNEFVAVRAGPDTDPGGLPALVCVEPMSPLLDGPRNIWNGVLPAPTIGVRSTRMSDVIVGTAAVRFVNAVDSIVSHGGYPFID